MPDQVQQHVVTTHQHPPMTAGRAHSVASMPRRWLARVRHSAPSRFFAASTSRARMEASATSSSRTSVIAHDRFPVPTHADQQLQLRLRHLGSGGELTVAQRGHVGIEPMTGGVLSSADTDANADRKSVV